MSEIPLVTGGFMKVDDVDAEWIAKRTWRVTQPDMRSPAVREVGTARSLAVMMLGKPRGGASLAFRNADRTDYTRANVFWKMASCERCGNESHGRAFCLTCQGAAAKDRNAALPSVLHSCVKNSWFANVVVSGGKYAK